MLYHLYYFSGTGNTEHSALRIADALGKRGQVVRTLALSRDSQPLPEKPDRLVLAYPTYAWRPPALVARFIARLPKGDGTIAAVFTADGGGSFGSVVAADKLLRRRGYRTITMAAAHYPVNWVEMMPTPTGEARLKAVERGVADTDAFIRALEAEEPVERERSGMDFLLNLIGLMFGAMGRHFLGKLFIADEDCTSCGLCARSCPAGAIVLGKGRAARPRWTWGCESCNRCMNLCPTRAINTSPVRGVSLLCFSIILMVLGFRFYGVLAEPLRPAIPAAAAALADVLAGLCILLASPFLALTALDNFVLRPLLAIPPLRRLAQKSFTKNFPRYSFEGYRAPEERRQT